MIVFCAFLALWYRFILVRRLRFITVWCMRTNDIDAFSCSYTRVAWTCHKPPCARVLVSILVCTSILSFPEDPRGRKPATRLAQHVRLEAWRGAGVLRSLRRHSEPLGGQQDWQCNISKWLCFQCLSRDRVISEHLQSVRMLGSCSSVVQSIPQTGGVCRISLASKVTIVYSVNRK